MGKQERVAVIGAGIVGAAVARALTMRPDQPLVEVLDKESRPSAHQSGRNSGVVHAGLYYEPGSLKSRLTRAGVAALKTYCQDNDLPYIECGKVLVARSAADEQRLANIAVRAAANGVPGVRLIDHSELRELEPAIVGRRALHSPTTAIVDYPAIVERLLQDVRDRNGQVLFGAEVTAIEGAQQPTIRIRRNGQEDDLRAYDRVFICAGLQADKLAELSGDTAFPRIVPFRGKFMSVRPDVAERINGLVYPVPDPRYPFLGVHLTKRVDGGVTVGPNAFLAASREAYGKQIPDLAELGSLLRWKGFRRFCRDNWRVGMTEAKGVVSARAFLKGARDFMPDLKLSDVEPAPAGIRAQAMDADGSLVEDFRISRCGAIVSVRNAPSPAATASLPIADHIVRTAYAD